MCVGVESPEPAKTLHSLWGERLVKHLEHELHTRGPAATATALEKRYPNAHIALLPTDQIAWETHQLAENEVYTELGIPTQPCRPTACIAPARGAVQVSQAYLDRKTIVVGGQLATGGYRLAVLLNAIWNH
jgi:S1/P1 nuclease